MSEQSKAIQMANLLNNEVIPDNLFADIEAELRRLDAENAALRAQLGYVDNGGDCIVYGARNAPQQVPVVDEREAFIYGRLQLLAMDPKLPSSAHRLVVEAIEAMKARAAHKPAVPEGYQLVPIEPTNKMIKEAWSMLEENVLPLSQRDKIICAYKAMLAAAKDGES